MLGGFKRQSSQKTKSKTDAAGAGQNGGGGETQKECNGYLSETIRNWDDD